MATTTEQRQHATRARVITEALDRSCVDGNLLIVNDQCGDAFVDGSAIRRGIVHLLANHAATKNMATLAYSLGALAQAVTIPGGPEVQVPQGISDRTPPTVALDILREACLRSERPLLLVLPWAEHLLPDEHMHSASGDTARIIEQVAVLAVDAEWRAAGHRVVLIGRTSRVHEHIQRMAGVTVLDVGLPNYDARRQALDLMLVSPRHALSLEPGLDLDTAARLTGGLALHELSAMRMHSSPEAPLTRDAIVEHKRPSIRRAAGDSLIIHDEALNLENDVAGLVQVRRFLDEEQARGNHTMRAILAGPPGNGKTRVATAIGAHLGVPVIELGRIRARYVGESEDNLRRALEVIAANAPVLVVLDECDQGPLGRRADTNGAEGSEVTSNLRAAMFSWLGDVGTTSGISVIGMTNRPDLLDPAACNRFTVLPVLHPSAWEVAQIMAIQARREGVEFDLDSATLKLLDAPAMLSGREAVRLLGRAQIHAIGRGSALVTGEDVAGALRESMHTIGVEEERQSLMAVRATSWLSHMPWEAARHYGDTTAEPPAYIAPFVRPDGSVDAVALEERIWDLGARHAF